MRKLLILSLTLLVSTTVWAQNLSTIKVDNLSDQEIQQILNQGKAKGISVTDGEKIALSMGLPADEAAKFKARADKLNGGAQEGGGEMLGAEKSIDTKVQETNEDQLNVMKSQAGTVDSNANPYPGKNLPTKVYGQGVFRQGDIKVYERTQDAKAPSNYVIGEGDELGVSIYGISYFNQTYEVDSRGNITMTNIGKINLRGLTFEEAQKLLRAKLAGYFNLDRNTLNLTLAHSRTITINVVGEVVNPGSYKLPAINTAFNALMAAGGPSDIGTLRNIQVMRDGQVVRTLDVYEFLLNPNGKQDLYLQDNDYLFVGLPQKRVTLTGAVLRPMIYELKHSESLVQLLAYGGGFAENAYQGHLQILRQLEESTILIDVVAADYAKTTVERGDIITVATANNTLRQFVRIDGAVQQPNTYTFEPGMTVRRAIEKAGGLLPDVVLKEAYISRTKEDLTLAFIPFSLTDVLNGTHDLALNNKDQVVILSKPDYDKAMMVSVQGAVRHPVSVAFAEGMNLGDVLRLAGGLTPSADYTRVEVSRLNAFNNFSSGTDRDVRTVALSTEVPGELSRNLSAHSESMNFPLQPFDQIVVREIPDFKMQEMVLLSGEVIYPGYYPLLTKDETMSSVIQRAGGITPFACPKDSRLERKNTPNIVMNLHKALAHRSGKYDYALKPGDVLIIPKKENMISIEGPGHKYFANTGQNTIHAPYTAGKRANDYVRTYALGFQPKADKNDTYVIYPNGKLKPTMDFGLFKIYPNVELSGKIVTVVKTPKVKKEETQRERVPLDMNNVVATVVSAITGFATLYVLITR